MDHSACGFSYDCLHLKMKNEHSLPILGISQVCEPGIDGDKFFIGRHEVMGKATLSKAHKHNFYSIFLIDSGTGSHSIDFIKHQVSSKMLFFLSAGQAHRWELDTKTTGFQLMFSQQYFPVLQGKLPFYIPSYDPFLALSDTQFKLIKREMEFLLNEFSSPEIFSDEITQYRMRGLLTLLHRWYLDANPQSDYLLGNSYIFQFFDLVESHFLTEKSVQFYASQLYITPNYLNIVCKRETGHIASHYIHERILLEAKRLLAMSTKNIKEIAFDLGFNDAAYFSRLFKKLNGISPKDFRTQL